MTNTNSSCTGNPENFDLEDSLLELECPIAPLYKIRSKMGETSWLIDKLFPENNITLISGAKGMYKTYFAWGLAVSVCIGDNFLGRRTKERRVLLIDRENPENVIKRRSYQLGAPEELYIWSSTINHNAPPPRMDNPRGLAHYLRLSKLNQPNPVFIFDTLSQFHSREENSNTEMQLVMQNFKMLRDSGATVILLHHCGLPLAGDRPLKSRGASAIEDQSDNCYIMHKTANRTVKLYCDKNRLEDVNTLTLKLEGYDGNLHWWDASVDNEEEF